ncbi:MAG: HNH endonuclease family protein [Rhodococcus sp. (in: high G+C Gram-positive bacteria)]
MPRSAVPNTGSIITTIRTKWPWILAGLLVLVLVTMLAPDPDDTLASGTGPAAPSEATDAQQIQTAFTQLSTLEVKGRAPKTGYDRELFGASWTDNVSVALGRNGCDTRNDILRRDLVDITSRDRTRDCVVQSGTLRDLYTGNIIAFTRGTKTSDAVQIDHVVALSDAWQKGAQLLDAQTRADLANDPRNLQAVDGPTNQRKSDADASTWLPPLAAYRCTYVARQVEVKVAYRLWVTQPERDAMAAVLTGCGAR